MHRKLCNGVTGIVVLAILCVFAQATLAEEVARMTQEGLKAKIDNPDVIIVDVRIKRDWDASKFKVKGAVRIDPKQSIPWFEMYPKDNTIVVYCA